MVGQEWDLTHTQSFPKLAFTPSVLKIFFGRLSSSFLWVHHFLPVFHTTNAFITTTILLTEWPFLPPPPI